MAQFNAHVVRWVAAVAVVQATISVPSMTRAQQPNDNSVVIDHATRTAYFVAGGERRRIDVGEHIRVPKPYRVRIKVENTNSALYTCGVAATVAHVPELDSLRAFLTAVGPFVEAAIRAGNPPTPEAAGLKAALDTLDRIVTGPRGLQWALRLTLEALDTLRFASGSAIRDLAVQLAGKLLPVCDSIEGCRSLVSGILGAESDIARRLEPFDQGNPSTYRPDATKTRADSLIVMAARAALAGEDKLVATAYGVEAVVRATLKASDTMVCDNVALAGGEGRDLTITVAPRPIPELARLADRRPYELKVTVLPKWPFRLAFSAAVLYAFDATFATYAPTSATPPLVAQSGTRDLRWHYGLTLGLTTDWRHEPGRFTWWQLEFTVSPSSDGQTFGIGTAFSWRVFKLGLGALWVRHDELDGISVGESLSDGLLRTKSVLGTPRFYLSASLIGWQR